MCVCVIQYFILLLILYSFAWPLRPASSKMLHLVAPSLSVVSSQPSTSTSAESTSAAPANLDFDIDLAMRSRNLSSTLHKLYLWEKKLYNEVKV